MVLTLSMVVVMMVVRSMVLGGQHEHLPHLLVVGWVDVLVDAVAGKLHLGRGGYSRRDSSEIK